MGMGRRGRSSGLISLGSKVTLLVLLWMIIGTEAGANHPDGTTCGEGKPNVDHKDKASYEAKMADPIMKQTAIDKAAAQNGECKSGKCIVDFNTFQMICDKDPDAKTDPSTSTSSSQDKAVSGSGQIKPISLQGTTLLAASVVLAIRRTVIWVG